MRADQRSRVTTLVAIDAFFGGISFILITPRMWPLAVVPAAILTVLLIGLTAVGVWGGAELSAVLFGPDRGTWGAIGYWVLTVFFVSDRVLDCAGVGADLGGTALGVCPGTDFCLRNSQR